MRTWICMCLTACGTAEATDLPEISPGRYVLAGATVPGVGAVDVEIDGAEIVAVGTVDPGLPRINVAGRTLIPAFIDAHVHLAYLPQGPSLAAAGVAGAVDWAAPLSAIRSDPAGPLVIWAGPMLAAPDGYPTTSWGRDGYGLVCTDAASGKAAVDRVYDAGGRVIKLSLGAGPDLDDDTLRAIVEAAHQRGMKVGVHALTDESVSRAADLGADVLVHAPRSGLTVATAKKWSGKVVIPTISAFGAPRRRACSARRAPWWCTAPTSETPAFPALVQKRSLECWKPG